MEGKAAGMHQISSMDRTSGFVRTLVRMQLSQNRQSSQGAMERLYERMKERGEDVEHFDLPKTRRLREIPNTSDNSSATEDEDDICDVDVSGQAQGRERAKSMGSGKQKELLRTSTGFLYTPRRRSPLPCPPSQAEPEEDAEDQKLENKVYTLRSANHSLAMNRGLTLAESVKKNYSKFIRTESVKTEKEVEQQPKPKTTHLHSEAMSIPESSPKTDSLSLPRAPVNLHRSNSSLGLITTLEEDMPAEMARSTSSLALSSFASLPTTPDRAQMLLTDESRPGVTETHFTATRVQHSGKGIVKKTEGRFRKRSVGNGEDRAEVMKELRKSHGLMEDHMKEVRLRKARTRVKAYKHEHLLRAERMATFQREMDDIMKRLRDINNRLDGRLRLLEREESLTKVEL